MSNLEKEVKAETRYLPNLAGNAQCDTFIRKELTEAGIQIEEAKFISRHSEVPAKLTGFLSNPSDEKRAFRLTRAWYYWVVSGDVPLSVAKEMYQDPVGKKDVRVAGHCGCPPPEEWAEHFDKDGKQLYPLASEKELLEIESGDSSVGMKEVVKKVRASTRYVEDPTKEAVRSVITTYHIDSQDGLNLFVNALKAKGIVK